MFSKKPITAAFLFTTMFINIAHGCPENSVSCDPENYNGMNVDQQIEVNGVVQGEIIETDDKIIIDGVKIVLDNDSESAINIGQIKKEVIINNTEIISNDFRKNESGGYSSSIVSIDNSDGGQSTINDVQVKSNNATIKITSSENEVCSAIVCLNDISGDGSGVHVEASGHHDIEANRN